MTLIFAQITTIKTHLFMRKNCWSWEILGRNKYLILINQYFQPLKVFSQLALFSLTFKNYIFDTEILRA